MNFIKRNYSLVAIICSIVAGIIVFFTSYYWSKDSLIKQTSSTIQMVTRVKRQLMDNKLYSLEQQLNLLAKNDVIRNLLSSTEGINAAPKVSEQFDEYIKGILYHTGYSTVLLIRPTGEPVYTSDPHLDKATIPPAVVHFAQHNAISKIVLNEKEPHQFYLCKGIIDIHGASHGTVVMEIPREFLSVELHNTISFDSLKSYLISSQGAIDQQGKVKRDTCVSCQWKKDDYITFSTPEKIEGTWKLLSVYPISEIPIRHIMYLSAIDGLIAFFVAMGIIMVIIYVIQLIQQAKGITRGDILLVQTTWNAVSEYSDKIIPGFYKYLFADAPEIRPMFKSDEAERQKRMALMINTIVNSADSLEEFKASISQLAKRHTHMGVKREYFPIVVKAIISSVEDQYGKGFTSAHKKSWYKILNQVSAIMIEEMDSYQRMLRHTAA